MNFKKLLKSKNKMIELDILKRMQKRFYNVIYKNKAVKTFINKITINK